MSSSRRIPVPRPLPKGEQRPFLSSFVHVADGERSVVAAVALASENRAAEEREKMPTFHLSPRRCGDVDRDQPGVFERSGEYSGAALAEVIVAPAAVHHADARLEPDAAAKAGGAQDGTDHLGPERCGDHAARYGCGRTAARPARSALAVPRISRATRLGCGKLFRHRLAEDDCAGIAQCRDAGRIAAGAAADK